jgi:hypothetical protein
MLQLLPRWRDAWPSCDVLCAVVDWIYHQKQRIPEETTPGHLHLQTKRISVVPSCTWLCLASCCTKSIDRRSTDYQSQPAASRTPYQPDRGFATIASLEGVVMVHSWCDNTDSVLLYVGVLGQMRYSNSSNSSNNNNSNLMQEDGNVKGVGDATQRSVISWKCRPPIKPPTLSLSSFCPSCRYSYRHSLSRTHASNRSWHRLVNAPRATRLATLLKATVSAHLVRRLRSTSAASSA